MKNNLILEEMLQKCPVQHSLKFISGKWRMGITAVDFKTKKEAFWASF